MEPTLFGERSVLDQLRRLDDEWEIYYSLSFLERRGFDRQREIDFLIVHPRFGLGFIEVKGGRVQFDGLRVRQYLDNGLKEIDPIRQLNGARRTCLQYLKSKGVSYVPARNLYVFPHTGRPTTPIAQEFDVCGIFKEDLGTLADTHQILKLAELSEEFDIDLIRRLLQPCLVSESRHTESRTSLPVEAGPDRNELPSLKLIRTTAGENFVGVQSARRVLSLQRERLQQLWFRATRERSEIERVTSESVLDGEDLVMQVLRETELLLGSSTIDIGIFGQVKRGKSTLLNALVGREVSATGMLPKTAVPVIVEHSLEESGLIELDDGSCEFVTIEEAVSATTQDDRKKRLKDKRPLVERVTVRLPIEWLPPGVRIVDTPGLADPSMSSVYESYALAELERCAAAIFLVVFPSGPERHEVELISRLSSFGVAKCFFVANMYQDIWKVRAKRTEAKEYLEELIGSSQPTGTGVHELDRRVHVVNLGMARTGQETGKANRVVESNLGEFTAALEQFLATGVLSRISVGASDRLIRVAEVIRATLLQRKSLIENPSQVEARRQAVRRSLAASEDAVDQIVHRCTVELEKLKVELQLHVSDTFRRINALLVATTNRSELRQMEARMSAESTALSAKLVASAQARVAEISAGASRELMGTIGLQFWNYVPKQELTGLFDLSFAPPGAIADFRPPTDHRVEARGLGALLGAVVSGGAGMALIALGPLGLALGAILGYVAGDALGELSSSPGNTASATTEEISRLLEAVRAAEERAFHSLEQSINGIIGAMTSSLHAGRNTAIREVLDELHLLDRILSDERSRTVAISQVNQMLIELDSIVG